MRPAQNLDNEGARGERTGQYCNARASHERVTSESREETVPGVHEAQSERAAAVDGDAVGPFALCTLTTGVVARVHPLQQTLLVRDECATAGMHKAMFGTRSTGARRGRIFLTTYVARSNLDSSVG